jgi:flavin reductase (DIM6/NTAB) family NADH-FMN oxidoreductase RutF
MDPSRLVTLDTSEPIWDRFFSVSPLVLIGSREADGSFDLAPKHMVTPMGWANYFGFVCTPRHRTYSNIARTGAFTVSYPRPSQLVFTSLAASPRCGEREESKTIMQALPTFAARGIDGAFMQDAYLFFECEHFKTIDGFEENSLITGRIVAAYADPDLVRGLDTEDQQTIHHSPLLAYLHPGRYTTIDHSLSFPFPKGMQK